MTRNRRLDILIQRLIIRHNDLVGLIKSFNPMKFRREGTTYRTEVIEMSNRYWQQRINIFINKYGNENEIKQLNNL